VSGVKTAKLQLTSQWQHTLSDYVTAIAWSPDGETVAAATAKGEVVLYAASGASQSLQGPEGDAINGLGFSADGRYLAWGGQSGAVTVWALADAEVRWQQGDTNAWIDTLTWHPARSQLTYGVGPTVHVLDMDTEQIVAKLDFEASSVLHLAWHPAGDRLAASGHGGVKVWSTDDWQSPPQRVAVPGASLYCDWSADGRYLGSGNLDRTLTVTEWDSPPPWLMQGFPGKVRQLTWSTPTTASGSPLIAAACMEGVTVWERSSQSKAGWRSTVLQHHQARVNAIAFQPNTLTLVSAGQDGHLVLWREGRHLDQSLKGFQAGVACVAWSPTGDRLAAAGTAGEVQLWTVSRRAQGFG